MTLSTPKPLVKRKRKFVVVPILNDEYCVVVVFCDLKVLLKEMKSCNYPQDNQTTEFINNSLEGRDGFTLANPRCHPIIWLKREPKDADSISTLAHEATHAVNDIFKKLQETPEAEEFYAHSVGAIVRKTLEALK